MNHKFLEIRNLKKRYFHGKKVAKEALKGVSLDIHQPEIFGLLGVNGAGKTTLSSILASLHPPTSGEVLWNGRSIYDDIISYRRIIGFCPQKPNIDKNFTISENLLFSARCYGMSKVEAEKRTDEMMERFDLKSYGDANSDHLSGGYRQRFLIARAMMHRPQLVILDEPTVGLDPHVRVHLWQTIRDLKDQGSTVLLTTHYLDEAEKLSDRVCFIHEGQIRLIDTPQNLMRDFKKEKLEDVFLKLMEQDV